MSKMNKTRSLPKKPEGHFIPEQGQIRLTQCCSFNPPEEWKIISKRMQKPTKKFINITVGNGNKKLQQSNQSSSRGIQSKQTMSRQLSHQSSREIFQKVKKDFIEQLQLWKQKDLTIYETQKTNTSRGKNVLYHNSDPYAATNPQEGTQECYYWDDEQANLNEDDNKASRNWMIPDLNSIEQVGVNFETSQGLKTQSSAMFSVFEG